MTGEEKVGNVAVMRTTTTEEGELDDREGLARPLTTSVNVVIGDIGRGVSQLLTDRGNAGGDGVADVTGVFWRGLAVVLRPEVFGRARTLRLSDGLFFGAAGAPGGVFVDPERIVAPGGAFRRRRDPKIGLAGVKDTITPP